MKDNLKLPQIAKKKPGEFERHQVAGDTERAMMGKPEKFGAAMPDDEEEPQPDVQGGLAPEIKPDLPAEGDKDTQIQELQSQNADLQSRLSRIEEHLKLPPQEAGKPALGKTLPASDYDDEY